MLFVSWLAEPLYLLLLLPATCLAQSGEEDTDLESRISCTSHISTTECSLTCKLTGSMNEDNQDEDDGVKTMKICFFSHAVNRKICLSEMGDSVTSTELNPLAKLEVTIHIGREGIVRKTIQLSKLVRPRSPEVYNVTVKRESNQAVFQIRTPYEKDYLKVENQLFQLFIWNTDEKTIQNVSSSDRMAVDLEHFRKNSTYRVKVRAIPLIYFKGSWSEWSHAFTFFIPDVQTQSEEKVTPSRKLVTPTRKLLVCLLALVVMISCFGIFWKKKIFSYMWPSIPHPKPTLVQTCKPNVVSLLLNLKPEEFSALNIQPVVETVEQERVLAIHCATFTLANAPHSTQNSDCSASTEELELSISHDSSCSNGLGSLQSSTLLATAASSPGEPLLLEASQKEEDYVTMASFLQIKSIRGGETMI
ncbi:interleukin-7 receptor subunit alpha [Stigmatopora argus]